MKKFINPRTKTISFENFLRGLKWCETSNTEDKLRGLKLERIFIKGSKTLIILFLRHKLHVTIHATYMHSFLHFLGIFRMLNNGNNLPKDIFRKIIERVYIQPEDKGVRTCDSCV